MQWNTGGLPDNAEILSATVTMDVESAASADNRGLSADWFYWPCCSNGSYTSTAGSNAIDGIGISELTAGATLTVDLLNANQHISRTATSAIRLHVSNGTPTGENTARLSSPTLTVRYRSTTPSLAAGQPGGSVVSAAVVTRPRVDALTVAATRSSPGVSFNRAGAVADADAHWNNGRPAPYQRFSTDCANFVSQAWHFGGGLNMTPNWYIKKPPLYSTSTNLRIWTASWACARCFADHMVNHRKIAVYRVARMESRFAPSVAGDVILYDWGRGQGWSHVAINTGYDSSGDKIDQHTNDRYRSTWNLGYQQERNPQAKRRMKALVVHVKVP